MAVRGVILDADGTPVASNDRHVPDRLSRETNRPKKDLNLKRRSGWAYRLVLG